MKILDRVDRKINRHLHSYLHHHRRRSRIGMARVGRLAHNRTPVLWCLKHVWWIPGFRWLERLRDLYVAWRFQIYNKRVERRAPTLYDWAGVEVT